MTATSTTTPLAPSPVHGSTHRKRGLAAFIAVAGLAATSACRAEDGSSASEPPPPTSAASSSAPTSTPSLDETDPVTSGAPGATAPGPLGELVEREDPSIFDYEVIRPVEYEVFDTTKYRGIEMQRIKFESDRGDMAYGYLSLPVGEPVPGVGFLWAHGAPNDGTDSFDPMAVFACAGATSIVVDAPYARPGALRQDGPFTWTPKDRDEQVQLVVDMRRALDILADLGAERFGMSGISYGGAIGGQLIGVDDRVEAALLLLGDGGVVERFTTEEGEPTWEIAGLTDSVRLAWYDAMLPIEPSRYIGDSEARILFMNGLDDPIIPPAEAERYHASARPGYEVYWMDIDHSITFSDFFFHNRWLGEPFGLDPERLDACTREIFPNGWDDL